MRQGLRLLCVLRRSKSSPYLQKTICDLFLAVERRTRWEVVEKAAAVVPWPHGAGSVPGEDPDAYEVVRGWRALCKAACVLGELTDHRLRMLITAQKSVQHSLPSLRGSHLSHVLLARMALPREWSEAVHRENPVGDKAMTRAVWKRLEHVRDIPRMKPALHLVVRLIRRSPLDESAIMRAWLPNAWDDVVLALRRGGWEEVRSVHLLIRECRSLAGDEWHAKSLLLVEPYSLSLKELLIRGSSNPASRWWPDEQTISEVLQVLRDEAVGYTPTYIEVVKECAAFLLKRPNKCQHVSVSCVETLAHLCTSRVQIPMETVLPVVARLCDALSESASQMPTAVACRLARGLGRLRFCSGPVCKALLGLDFSELQSTELFDLLRSLAGWKHSECDAEVFGVLERLTEMAINDVVRRTDAVSPSPACDVPLLWRACALAVDVERWGGEEAEEEDPFSLSRRDGRRGISLLEPLLRLSQAAMRYTSAWVAGPPNNPIFLAHAPRHFALLVLRIEHLGGEAGEDVKECFHRALEHLNGNHRADVAAHVGFGVGLSAGPCAERFCSYTWSDICGYSEGS